jgi:hypothetical protein
MNEDIGTPPAEFGTRSPSTGIYPPEAKRSRSIVLARLSF